MKSRSHNKGFDIHAALSSRHITKPNHYDNRKKRHNDK